MEYTNLPSSDPAGAFNLSKSTSGETPLDIPALNAKIREQSAFIEALQLEMDKVIVGQKHLTDRLLIGLLTNGHILLEGLPGLAKTLSITTLAKSTQASFSRIQFTPDLLPADILGTQIYSPKTEQFQIRKGPVFANFILADEINRAPAKVQSALLEAMQERQITIGQDTFLLPDPFLVLATQNPIEQEGTYPLPEAQMDRFMLHVKVGYPTAEEERKIVSLNLNPDGLPKPLPVLNTQDLIQARKLVRNVYMDEKIERYIVQLVFATRDPKAHQLKEFESHIQHGASPRASINLALAAKAYAFMKRRGYVIPEDVRAVAHDVMRHRIGLSYEAQAEQITTDFIITEILKLTEVP